MGLGSCMHKVKLTDGFILEGKCVTLIDTPGSDDTSRNDADVFKMIAAVLATRPSLRSPVALVVYRLYLHVSHLYKLAGLRSGTEPTDECPEIDEVFADMKEKTEQH